MSDTPPESSAPPIPPPPPPAPKRPHRSRRGLFIPFLLFALLVAGWCGYWFFAADQLRTRIERQSESLRQAGYVVEYAPLAVKGFPFRLHVPLRDVRLRTPGGQGFAAASIDAEAMAYAPTTWVVNVPGTLTYYRGRKDGADRGTVALSSDRMRFSVSGLRRAVPSWAFEGVNVKATASNPADPFAYEAVSRIEAYSRPNVTPDAAGKETVTADAFDFLFRLSEASGGTLSKGGVPLNLHLEGTVHKASAMKGDDFADALAKWQAARGQMTGFAGSARMGEASLLLSSQALRLDEARALTGYMDVEMEGSGKPFEIMNALGLISGEDYPYIEPLLGISVNTNGARKITLGFRDGRVWLGPINLSKAPVFP